MLSISHAFLHNEDYTHFSVFSTVVLDGWDIASYISSLYLTNLMSYPLLIIRVFFQFLKLNI